jgi:hypothetical protein
VENDNSGLYFLKLVELCVNAVAARALDVALIKFLRFTFSIY